jgi:uncharacterized protein YhhL (DUF1145 family)
MQIDHQHHDRVLMNSLLKATCLAVYLTAVIASLGVLPATVASAVQQVAVILLALHVLELLVTFKSVRRHPGPLIDSIGLTLLFGLLHWLPLAKAKPVDHHEAQ